MSAEPSIRALLSASPLAPNEARILLSHVIDKHYQLSRSALLSQDDLVLNPIALSDWKTLESKRLAGEPIAYLIGKKGFHAIELTVAPGVLIPRPETELLVDIALDAIKTVAEPIHVLDLGTGSGAIALAIAHSANNVALTATDQSLQALKIAQQNALNLKLDSRISFKQGSWYQALEENDLFDVIVSNPPYIAKGDVHLGQGDLRFEPQSALTDNLDGLSCLKVIIFGANAHLQPEGLIAVEHGFDQGKAVMGMMAEAGLRDIQNHADLAGHPRVSTARK
jgi:release factor glutamine methyltransferase